MKNSRACISGQRANSRPRGSDRFLVLDNLATSARRGCRYSGIASTDNQKIESWDQNDSERVEKIMDTCNIVRDRKRKVVRRPVATAIYSCFAERLAMPNCCHDSSILSRPSPWSLSFFSSSAGLLTGASTLPLASPSPPSSG